MYAPSVQTSHTHSANGDHACNTGLQCHTATMCTAEAYASHKQGMNMRHLVVLWSHCTMVTASPMHAAGRQNRSVTCNAVMAQVRPPLLHLTLEREAIWVGAREEIQHRGVVVQYVHRVLVVTPNGQMGVPTDGALGRGDVTRHELEKG